MFYLWPCLLLSSIVLAGILSQRVVRLYFAAQFIVTVAEYLCIGTPYYALVYIMATLLMLEMSVFLLWDEGIGRVRWRDAWMFGCWMTIAGTLGLSWLSLTDWYLMGEGMVFAVLGIVMHWRGSASIPLRAIGTLTLAMSVYDFLYLLRPEVRELDWAPSLMCTVTFLWVALRSRVWIPSLTMN